MIRYAFETNYSSCCVEDRSEEREWGQWNEPERYSGDPGHLILRIVGRWELEASVGIGNHPKRQAGSSMGIRIAAKPQKAFGAISSSMAN